MKSNNSDESKIKQLEANIAALEQRTRTLEGEVAVCLRYIREYAEKAASKVDPTFKVHVSAKA